MISIDDLSAVVLGFALLAPGFLIMFGRSRFLTGRMISVSSAVFEYLVVSTIYFAAIYPLLPKLMEPTYPSTVILLVIAPLCAGFALGFLSQKQYLRRFLANFGVNPIHSSPTGWDFVFGNREGFSWIVVTLANDKRFFGIFGPDSLSSSDLENKDIFIENICDSEFRPIEKDGRKRGVWINGAEIRSIEIVGD